MHNSAMVQALYSARDKNTMREAALQVRDFAELLETLSSCRELLMAVFFCAVGEALTWGWSACVVSLKRCHDHAAY